MNNKYASLFEPMKIGKTKIKNRIGMSPMAASGMITPHNCFDKRAAEYYVERARGGAGLIITGGVEVENEIEQTKLGIFQNISTNPVAFALNSSEMIERVHAHGSKIFLQLTMGFGRSLFLDFVDSHPVAPSAIPHFWEPDVTCRELTTNEVEYMVEKMAEAAKVAASAGYDGVEVHAMHEGYLLDQFTLKAFNKRTDKYGGDLRGRLQLPIEILQAIKSEVGQDFPVILRYGVKSCIKAPHQGGLPGEDYQEHGRDLEEGLEAAKILEEAGYDGFNADLGSYEALYWAHPPTYIEHGCYLPYTKQLKEVIDVPVLTAGRMDNPEVAAEAVTSEKTDMALLGRGLLADPDWPNKVKSGETDKIRPCLGCHDGCMGRLESGKVISCAVNPACGREEEYKLHPPLKQKDVMVVGGGIAGMEAARVAAIRGHKVSLYEKNNSLGGHVVEASVPEFKKDERELLRWYGQELKENDVELNLGTEVDSQLVKEINPDEIILATGAKEKIPPIQGIDQDHVLTACDALMNPDKVGKNVAIIGGGLVGCEIAIWLAQQNKQITIVEMIEELMGAVFVSHANEMMLKDMIKHEGIEVKTDTSLLEVQENEIVTINKEFKKQNLNADTVLLAIGYESDTKLYEELKDIHPKTHLIGDARTVQNIMYGIWEGYEVARTL
ncbi:FAD-dependent oxidoreductase [Natranaerobius thermophilus]|uniref:NADH:flavin oxidoreductase/NADH oxidase n=1 Tax=Natranaerobius thermophilus (strain ATCC BAA-1301 / DSM 18059 / JW/NM-WN-LF) TaxID=457570 RepID=B2A604_NATTJ|nr:FAD-dependent oxidoreductase [Natranaerobius thermophilus]ACB85421.1 NADH:flavin oxidoreductase/NADH oxidase [Natranaerobius thermophilus JW/NM-WN-LF]